jgi:predicted anti-sigma-YlaC factor YlaD
MSNNCPPIKAFFVSGIEQRSGVDEHVAGCKACSSVLALVAFRHLPDRPSAHARCTVFLPDIALFAEGGLEIAGMERLATHLAECATCREVTARLASFGGDLDDVPEPILPAETGVAPVPLARAPSSTRR